MNKILSESINLNSIKNTTYQVLIGSILGDGSLIKLKGHLDYCFQEGHGEKQKEYVHWKGNILAEFKPRICKGVQPTLCTLSHRMFTILRSEFYKDKNKKNHIPLNLVKDLGHLGLLIWYLDDGNYNKGNYPSISSKNFNYKEIFKIVDLINKNLKLNLTVKQYTKENRIEFGVENRDQLWPVFKEIFIQYKMPKCMEYKIKKPSYEPLKKYWLVLTKEYFKNLKKSNKDAIEELGCSKYTFYKYKKLTQGLND